MPVNNPIPHPMITIAGEVTKRMEDNKFYLDVQQHGFQKKRTSAFHVTIPVNNLGFAKLGLPTAGTLIAVTGVLSGEAEPYSMTCNLKRLPVTMQEISYLSLMQAVVHTKGVFNSLTYLK